MTKRPLLPSDIELIGRSWLDEAAIEAARLFRVDDIDGAQMVGRKERDHCAGVVFPYYWPGASECREYRIRRDNPDITYEGDKRKETAKYLSPPGRGNLLYFPPGVSAELLADAELPIVLTEGEKKTLSLWRLAWWNLPEGADTPRFLPVGLAGVWNWKGKIGREPADNGGWRDVKGPIPDLARVPMEHRKVTILFDANVRTNDSVRAARAMLAGELHHNRKAEVYLATLPAPKKDELINGIDDFLYARGPEPALDLIQHARYVPRPAKPESSAGKQDDLLTDLVFFQTAEQKLYAQLPLNGHREIWPLKSRAFQSWLSRQIYQRDGKAAGQSVISDLLNHCTAAADATPARDHVHLRVGGSLAQRHVWLDTGTPEWNAIEVTSAGWRCQATPAVYFRRARGFQALPSPITGSSLNPLRKFCNAEDQGTFIMLCAWLIGAMSPAGPYPILMLQGEQGSAKSTTARVLRNLIDPARPAVRSTPKDERDLMIAASNCWILSLDNMSGTPQWLSDALCRLSTGGGFATRELHSDAEETIFEATRPVIMNGIDDIATQADLLDRALVVTLPSIPEERRRAEREFWQDFDSQAGALLGSVLTAVAGALQKIDDIRLDSYPRMADFTRWVCAAAESGALPFSARDFLDIYQGNRQEAVAASIEANPVAASIERLMEERGHWEGTAGELLETLDKAVSDKVRNSRAWPKDVRAIGNRIRRVAPMLRKVGIEAEFQRSHGRRFISIGHKKNIPATTAPTAPEAEYAL
jgi:hypothetical protein